MSMSAQVKQIWEMLIKSMGIILIAILAYIFNSALSRLDQTYETVIRVDERTQSLDQRVKSIEAKMK